MTLAGLRTYSGLVFIQNAFPLPLSGHSGMDLSPLLIEITAAGLSGILTRVPF